MKKFVVLFLTLSLITFKGLIAQVSFRPSLSLGPSFSILSNSKNELNNGFFTSGKAGLQIGAGGSMGLSDRLFLRGGVNYSRQSFSFKKNNATDLAVDFTFSRQHLELPVLVGFSGYLGSLLHREFIGVSYNMLLGDNLSTKISGDSTAGAEFTVNINDKKASFLNYLVGFEVGSSFNNDGAIFFGLSYRFSPVDQYGGLFKANPYPEQKFGWNGNYALLEITYYFPRVSYWFKRDFTY
jgi:hypothetical protein